MIFRKLLFILLSFLPLLSMAFEGNYAFQLESATPLEISSTTLPKKGMMVYNTSINSIYFYNGSSWIEVSNFYTTNGSMSSTREVNLSSHTLSFVDGNVDINGSFRVNGIFYDKDGDVGLAGQILSTTVTGTNWITPTLTPIPYISSSVINVPIATTQNITLKGYNFISTSIVTIPSFDGTINSTTIISPLEIELNITTLAVNTFDFVVSNAGNLNTQWSGNGVGLLNISNANGQTQASAGLNCKTLLADGFSTGDGNYWIDPDGGSTANAFEVYCNMTNDGGGWILVFRHDASGGYFANDTQADSFNEASPGLTTKKYSILHKIDTLKSTAVYEFRLYYPNESKRNHWTQTFDPRSGTSPTNPVAGYTAIAIDSSGSLWGGLELDSSNNTFLDGSVNHVNWWYSIGSDSSYGSGGIPGPSTVVQIVELFIR